MTVESIKFLKSLDDRVDAILESCVGCGACAEVCPTPKLANIKNTEPMDLVNGVLDILRGEEVKETARIWAERCCGSGFCQSACDYGINPRFMLAMARKMLSVTKPEKMHQNLLRI